MNQEAYHGTSLKNAKKFANLVMILILKFLVKIMNGLVMVYIFLIIRRML